MQKFVLIVLVISALLYVAAAIGFFFQGKWELGVSYLAYAVANAMFARL